MNLKISFSSKAVWVIIVFSSLTVASFFLATSIVDFVNRSVVTTIESTTASLQVQTEVLNYPADFVRLQDNLGKTYRLINTWLVLEYGTLRLHIR